MAINHQNVIFKVGKEEFAIDILLTKEIVVMCDITPVPETEDYVEGVMNLRGNLVPVLDLRKRMRADGTISHDEQRIIISNFDNRLVGLIVDGASEVIRVNNEMIEAPPDVIAEMGVGYISGVVHYQGRFITLIDLNKVLSDDALMGLEEVMNLLGQRKEAVA